jgi:hypothetical protein
MRNHHHPYYAKPVPCQYQLTLSSIAPFGLVTMTLVIILFCHKVLPLHKLGIIMCWGTPPNLPTTPRILDSKLCCHDQMRACLRRLDVAISYLQLLRSTLAMIHLSCRTIPLLSVSQPQYIWAIDLLSLTLIGSHRQMCPCLRYMLSMVLPVGCEYGIFGSQGMIWWWILRSASSHLQNCPQEMSFISWHRLSKFCLPPRFMTNTLEQVYC